MNHHIQKCSKCKKIIQQCRCMACNKPTEYIVCSNCKDAPLTETTCPTCGAKCISNPKYRDDYAALPQPDLTKLMEVYDRHNEGGVFMYDNYNIAINKLWQAVKELLGENKS